MWYVWYTPVFTFTLLYFPQYRGHLRLVIGLAPVQWTPPACNPGIGNRPMSSRRYSLEFKDEAVRQTIDRGYSVAEISEHLGVSSHSL